MAEDGYRRRLALLRKLGEESARRGQRSDELLSQTDQLISASRAIVARSYETLARVDALLGNKN